LLLLVLARATESASRGGSIVTRPDEAEVEGRSRHEAAVLHAAP
jgi:hypothetical protein